MPEAETPIKAEPDASSSEDGSKKAEESATEVLQTKLEELEKASTEKLSKSPCGSEELDDCFELEATEAHAEAASCFEEAPPWMDLTKPNLRCDVHHFIKAAANFERADMKKEATERRMKAFQVLAQTGSTEALVLLVDRSDYLVSAGNEDRARELYALFLSAGADSQPEVLIEHVREACEQTGGPCELEKEITDKEVDERLGK